MVLRSWARHLTLTVPLSTQEYKWVPANCWGNLKNCRGVTCDGLASHPGGVEILLSASCYRNLISSSSYEPWIGTKSSLFTKTRYSLTSFMWPYCWLKFRGYWDHVLFLSRPIAKWCFSIGSQAQARLTCCNQGQVVLKAFKVITGLHNFFLYKIVFTCYVFKFRGPNNINRKPHHKVKKLESKFSLIQD